MAFDRALAEHEAFADPRVRAAFGHEPEDLALSSGQLVELALRLGGSVDQCGDDLRVDDRAAGRHAAHRVGELREIRDAVLEQVAAPRTTVLEQPHRIVGLDVLRENDDADRRVIATDHLRRPKALVGVRRGHANVDEDDVRSQATDAAEEILGVVRLGDDLESVRLQDSDQAVAEQQRVVGDDDSHLSARRPATRAPVPTARAWE